MTFSVLFQVSWIRKESLHIISAGHYTYTSDPRFFAKHQLNSSEWNLRIQKTKKSDEGRYECQLSTQPVKSFFIDLKVVGNLKWILVLYTMYSLAEIILKSLDDILDAYWDNGFH